MKYLHKLFYYSSSASVDTNNQQQYHHSVPPEIPSSTPCLSRDSSSSCSSTATLYSVAFVPEQSIRNQKELTATSLTLTGESRISIIAHSDLSEIERENRLSSSLCNQSASIINAPSTSCMVTSGATTSVESRASDRNRKIASASISTNNQPQQVEQLATGSSLSSSSSSSSLSEEGTNLIDDGWFLVNKEVVVAETNSFRKFTEQAVASQVSNSKEKLEKSRSSVAQSQQQMALDITEIDLIKTSWDPVRKDPAASGVLLFKGLFTKFPLYLDFFTNFSDLNVERLQEDKRLLKHAVIVIDKVTSVVDSVGDDSKSAQLNKVLVNLVRSHLKKNIGLTEFRSLGIVLIDFICDVNQRRSSTTPGAKLNTNLLVTAWTKLYSSILDLVKQEADLQAIE